MALSQPAPAPRREEKDVDFIGFHTKLRLLIKAMGYPTDEQGMCYGIALMGMQAILAGQLDTFNERLINIALEIKSKGSPENLAKAIIEIEKKRADDLAKYRMDLLKGLASGFKNKALLKQAESDDVVFYQLLKNKELAQNPHMKMYKQKREELEMKFTPEEQKLRDIRPFLQNVALISDATEFPEIFDEKEKPDRQNTEFTFVRSAPDQLLQVETKNVGQKLETKELVLFQRAATLTGLFVKEKSGECNELTKYFELLQTKIPSDLAPPPCFILSDSTHTICVSCKNNMWILIEPNNLPGKEYKSAADIATRVHRSFSTNEVTTFSTQVYCLNNQLAKVNTWLKEDTPQLAGWAELFNVKGKEGKQDSKNASLLYIAAESGDLNTITALLDSKDTNINLQEKTGYTALLIAAARGFTHIVDTLLEHKADPNIVSTSNDTALTSAVEEGHTVIVNSLLKSKAEPNATPRDGECALITAIEEGYTEIVRALLESKANPEVKKKDLEDVKTLLIGIGPSRIPTKIDLPLSLAIKNDRTDMIRPLIISKANLYDSSGKVHCFDIALNQGNHVAIKEIMLCILEEFKARPPPTHEPAVDKKLSKRSTRGPDLNEKLSKLLEIEKDQEIDFGFLTLNTFKNFIQITKLTYRLERIAELDPDNKETWLNLVKTAYDSFEKASRRENEDRAFQELAAGIRSIVPDSKELDIKEEKSKYTPKVFKPPTTVQPSAQQPQSTSDLDKQIQLLMQDISTIPSPPKSFVAKVFGK